ncbi:MAG: metallophosphoesterase family protein [Chloroflexota bacterium]
MMILQKRFGWLIVSLLGMTMLACALETRLPTHTPTFKPTDTVSPTENLPPTTEITASVVSPTAPVVDTPTVTTQPAVRFAVIGDYGSGNADEGRVAELVKSWQVDFIVTTGDNNYPIGSRDTIDAHIGQFYHEYIAPYRGTYGKGAEKNRFFPTLGNHDWMSEDARPYLDYFELPGNERYYDFSWGAVHFFALDSDSNEPDGVGRSSKQAQWLEETIRASTLPWQIVVMHHPPYSSGTRGAVEWMRWPFREWGVDAVLSGHDHYYERLIVDGLVYIINGAGGGGLYDFGAVAEGSKKRFNGDYGALLVTADTKTVFFQFFTVSGQLVDQYELNYPN